MSISSEEVTITHEPLNLDNLNASDVYCSNGIASSALFTLLDRINNNLEAVDVVLKIARKEIQTKQGETIKKGTIIVCNSEFAREGYVNGKEEIIFQPKEVSIKKRKNWSLEDVFVHVLLPKMKENDLHYIDIIHKERAKNITDISNTHFISCSSDIKFNYLVEVLKEHEISYVWLEEFCRKDYLNNSHSLWLLTKGYDSLLDNCLAHSMIVQSLKLKKSKSLKFLFHAFLNEKFNFLMNKQETERLLKSLLNGFTRTVSAIESNNIYYMSISNPILDRKVKELLMNEREEDEEDFNHYTKKYEIIHKDDYESYLVHEKSNITGYEYLNEIIKKKIWNYILNLVKKISKPILNYYQTMNSNFMNDITQVNIDQISLTGKLLQHLSRYVEAKDYFKMALILSKILHTETSIDFSNRLKDIGDMYKEIGESKSALDFYIESLNIKKILNKGGIDDTMSSCLTSISLIFEEQGRYDDAIICQRKALDLDKVNFGDSHIEVGLDLSNLGSMYSRVNDYDTSLNVLNQSLDIIVKTYGPYHSKTGIVYNNLAALYSDKQEFDRAIEIQTKVIKIDNQIYGHNHIQLANDYSNLASYLSFIKSDAALERSLRYFFKALKIQIDATLTEHGLTASLLNNLAHVFNDLDDIEKALYYGHMSVRILKKVYGYDHPYTQNAIESWGDPDPIPEEEEEGEAEREGDEQKESEDRKEIESKVILNAMKQFKTKDDLAQIFDETDSNPGEVDDSEEEEDEDNNDSKNKRNRRKKKRKSFFHGMERKDLIESRKLRKSQKFTPINVTNMLENRKSMQRNRTVLMKSGFGSEFEADIDWEEAEQNFFEDDEESTDEYFLEKKKFDQRTQKNKRSDKIRRVNIGNPVIETEKPTKLKKQKTKKEKTKKEKKKKEKKKKKKRKEFDPQGLQDLIPNMNDFRDLFGLPQKKKKKKKKKEKTEA